MCKIKTMLTTLSSLRTTKDYIANSCMSIGVRVWYHFLTLTIWMTLTKLIYLVTFLWQFLLGIMPTVLNMTNLSVQYMLWPDHGTLDHNAFSYWVVWTKADWNSSKLRSFWPFLAFLLPWRESRNSKFFFVKSLKLELFSFQKQTVKCRKVTFSLLPWRPSCQRDPEPYLDGRNSNEGPRKIWVDRGRCCGIAS